MSLIANHSSFSVCARQTSTPSQTTCFRESTGSSSVRATLHLLPKPGLQLLLHEVPRLFEGDAVDDLAEEALDDHPGGGRGGDASALQVPQAHRVHRAHG